MIGLNYSSQNIFTDNEKYKLSSIITEDNLFFGLTRIKDGKLLSVKEIVGLKIHYYFDIELLTKIFEDNNLFDHNIIDVSIAYLISDFSIIPKSVLNTTSIDTAISSVSIKQYDDEFDIEKSFISTLDSYSIFPFPKKLKSFLSDNYSKFQIYHANDALIDQFANQHKNSDVLLVNLHEYHLQTLIFKKGNFVQGNVYDIKTKDDILYYILRNLNNNGIPVNLVNVILSGRVEQKSAIYDLLYDHIKEISFIQNILFIYSGYSVHVAFFNYTK
jgi:hypothetical protein